MEQFPGVPREGAQEKLDGLWAGGRTGEGLKIEESALKQRRGCAWMRGVAAEMLCRFGGLTQVEAARRLGLTSGAAVCIRLNELRAKRRQDRGLDGTLRKIESLLEKPASALL